MWNLAFWSVQQDLTQRVERVGPKKRTPSLSLYKYIKKYVFVLSVSLHVSLYVSYLLFVFVFVLQMITWEWKWVAPISVFPPVDLHTGMVNLHKCRGEKPAFKYLYQSPHLWHRLQLFLQIVCFQIISLSGFSPPAPHWQCSRWSKTCRRCWGWPAPWTRRTRPSRPPPPRAPLVRRMAGDSFHSCWTATYM